MRQARTPLLYPASVSATRIQLGTNSSILAFEELSQCYRSLWSGSDRLSDHLRQLSERLADGLKMLRKMRILKPLQHAFRFHEIPFNQSSTSSQGSHQPQPSTNPAKHP